MRPETSLILFIVLCALDLKGGEKQRYYTMKFPIQDHPVDLVVPPGTDQCLMSKWCCLVQKHRGEVHNGFKERASYKQVQGNLYVLQVLHLFHILPQISHGYVDLNLEGLKRLSFEPG